MGQFRVKDLAYISATISCCARVAGRFLLKRSGLAQYNARGIMRFLLTCAGISNTSIHDALATSWANPITESSALCIPTAAYAMPGGADLAWRLISGSAKSPLCELGGSRWEC